MTIIFAAGTAQQWFVGFDRLLTGNAEIHEDTKSLLRVPEEHILTKIFIIFLRLLKKRGKTPKQILAEAERMVYVQKRTGSSERWGV